MSVWRPPSVVRPIAIGIVRRGDELLLTVLENLYSHHGAAGHEIVFVFETAFADEGAYRRERFSYDDGGVRNDVAWVALARFCKGEAALFPDGLLQHLIDKVG